MRNNFLIKTICVLIGVIFLTMSVGKVTSVFALAAPSLAPAINPVYDTEIIELKNYVETLSPGSREVFYVLAGLAVAAQGGSQNAKLVNPYSQPSDVYEWLSGCGVNLYNNVVGYTGTYNTQLGIDVGPILKVLVAHLMGDAVFAAQYQSLNEFTTDTSSIYMPFDLNIQTGIDFLFALNSGLYEWQFQNADWFDYDYAWVTPDVTGSALDDYHSAVATLTNPIPLRVLGSNYSFFSGAAASTPFISSYDLFIDTQNHTVGFVSASGNFRPTFSSDVVYVYYGSVRKDLNSTFTSLPVVYNPNAFHSYQDVASYYLNYCDVYPGSVWFASTIYSNNTYCIYFPTNLFSGNVFVGDTWATRQPLENLTNLNFEFDVVQYYEQLQGEYLLDIRNLLGDLVNQTDLHVPVFNNIVDPYGNEVLDPLYKLVNVSLNIQKYLDELNPPLPVNLNDISEYTDNTYLEKVKENARNFGDIFANYIFFWHNCDAELVYVCFGAGILVLIAAFIGKWGHS